MNFARAVISSVPPRSRNSIAQTSKMMSLFAEGWTLIQRRGLIALARPLTVREIFGTLVLILIAGTVYCQVYCLLALQQMGGESMPIIASVARAGSDVIPAFLGFEAGKRALTLPRLLRWPVVVGIFLAALSLGLAIRLQVPMMSQSLTLRHMAVDRIPFLLLAAAGLGFYSFRSRRASHSDVLPSSEARDRLPPASAIEWIKAAGNYVEVRVAGRTRLLRMTLRQARAELPRDQFLQIHRSVIVNRERITSINGRRSVEMSDGTSFTVGDAHRSNLP